MTICRYFLQGNCRFGDRCRFEHTDPDSSYQAEPSRKGYYNNYSNRGSYNNQGSYIEYSNRSTYNDGYNKRNYNAYENRSSYNNDRRNDYTPHENRYQSGGYNQYNQRYAPERSFQSEMYGSGTQEIDFSYGQGNKYGQNSYEWVSEDYRKQRNQQRGTQEFYNTSTPKSTVNFSFRDSELGKKTDRPVDLHMNEQNLVYVELIKEDLKSWELGSQWPFSCYSPLQERSSLPGFTDVSPEELRYEAYKARENNDYGSYVESVEKALQNVNARRNQLKVPTMELISIIEKFRSGQDIGAENEVDSVFPLSSLSQSPIEDMLADEPSLPQSAAASFSFKQAPTNSLKMGSNFSFKVDVVDSKPTAQVASSDIYTPLENLVSADKEQFSASTFSLGKIPTVPPPQELCF